MDASKEELFLLLAEYIAEETPPERKQLVSTFDTHVQCTPADVDTTQLELCTQKKADTLILIHVADCVAKGYMTVTICTTDTEVGVLLSSIWI